MTVDELVISCAVSTRFTLQKEVAVFQLKSRFAVVCLAFGRRNQTLYLWQVVTSASCQASPLYRGLPVPTVASIALLLVFGSRSNPVADSNICPTLKHSQKQAVQPNISRFQTRPFSKESFSLQRGKTLSISHKAQISFISSR